jgi:hypothetical protein
MPPTPGIPSNSRTRPVNVPFPVPGGGTRFGLSIIALSLTRDCKPHKRKGLRF